MRTYKKNPALYRMRNPIKASRKENNNEYDNEYEIRLHRDTIKYFAMFAMLLNHISYIFMETGTFWAEFFYRYRLLYCDHNVLFLSGGLYLYTFQKAIRKRDYLCSRSCHSFHIACLIRREEY